MLRLGQPVDLGAMPLLDLTRFLACHADRQDGELSILFSTGLILEGLPSERHAAILRWVIDSKDAFFRYLRLLLSELGRSVRRCAGRAGRLRSAARGARATTTRRFLKRWCALLSGRRSAACDRTADHAIGGRRGRRSRSRSRRIPDSVGDIPDRARSSGAAHAGVNGSAPRPHWRR